jgi:DNA-binding MarR family transcriptional regulator
MIAPQRPPVPFGRQLGTAARTARALLDDVLAAEATTYETWIAFNLLAASEPGILREEFARDLATALQVNNGTVITQLLGQLELVGWIRTVPVKGVSTNNAIEMTAAGEAHYQRLAAAVRQRGAQALAEVDPTDLQTTIRVLGQFREGAEASLAG